MIFSLVVAINKTEGSCKQVYLYYIVLFVIIKNCICTYITIRISVDCYISNFNQNNETKSMSTILRQSGQEGRRDGGWEGE